MEGPVNWASVDLLLSQLGDMLDPREDVDYLQEGIASLKTARDEFAHTEETLRGLAIELQNEADEQEGSVELSHVIEEQKQQLDELMKEKEAARVHLEQVKQDITLKEESIKKAEEEYSELVAKCNQAKLEANLTKTKVKNVFLLYHELTKIKWDYDSPLIKGVMTRLKFNDVIDFEIDPANNSEYDIANTLWDLMEGEESKVIV